jgi:hypothetical protein
VRYRNNINNFTSFSPDDQSAHRQFDQLEASVLFCPHCKEAVPVRKKLLLALPDGDKYDYLCVYCGNSVGTKLERQEIPIQIIL